ncbi:hypothetical protein [Dyella tabacisoli]|uniref:Uncharacterized protein n=1 Tax=Dyella tabacisoli TaxID=2282381 RepID=A0A369UNC1_9GAMM|nr:hypothetical protein [Dyella tabacisoli]RDD79809.1 hypothetical protein DVJ77_20300 [Dyella tabacisoli]
MKPADLGQAFLNREAIPGVAFMHNDYVQVLSGESVGSFGSLVTVLELKPEAIYILELETGLDIQVSQSDIRLVDR